MSTSCQRSNSDTRAVRERWSQANRVKCRMLGLQGANLGQDVNDRMEMYCRRNQTSDFAGHHQHFRRRDEADGTAETPIPRRNVRRARLPRRWGGQLVAKCGCPNVISEMRVGPIFFRIAKRNIGIRAAREVALSLLRIRRGAELYSRGAP